MEFLTSQPSVLPPSQYTYQGRVIINLTGHDAASSGGGLTSTLSRGSEGGRRASVLGSGDRRASFGKTSGGTEDTNGSSGLKKILSRGDGTGRRSSEVPPGGLGGGRRGSIGTESQKTGKWEAKGTIGLTQTHLIVRLDQPLVPYGSPTSADASSHTGGGIGDKIKGLLNRRGSKDTAEDRQLAANTAAASGGGAAPASFNNYNLGQTDTNTTGSSTVGGSNAGHQHLDISYPSHINGQAVTYITIPLTAISPVSEVKEYKDKRKSYNAAVVSAPVRGHFGALVGPALGELGRDHDQSWGRSGKVKFEFDTNSLSGKAEAEVLHHAIVQSVHAVNGSA